MANKFPLDLSKFKKVASDANTTTLAHPDGHSIVVAHKALSPKMRGQMAEMPIHRDDGGSVPESDPKKTKEFVSGVNAGDVTVGQAYDNAKKALGFADGGDVVAGVGKRSDLEAFQSGMSNQKAPDQHPGSSDSNYKMGDAEDAADQGEAQAAKQYGPAYAKGGKIKKMALGGDPLTQKLADQEAVTVCEGGIEKGADPNATPQTDQGKEFAAIQSGQGPGGLAKGGKVKKYADGGDVAPDTSDSDPKPVVVNVNTAQPQAPDQSLVNPNAPQMPAPDQGAQQAPPPQQAQPGAPDPSAGQQPAAAPQQPDPYGNEAYNKAYLSGLGEQKQGLMSEAQAAGQQGQAEAKALQQSNQGLQQIGQTYQDNLDQLTQEHQNLMEDVKNQQIDPKHYLNSMGTGQRIATGIGLILGGMASGLTGSNAAMNFLQSNIDRDIDAQKANLGKSENLLGANLKQFGNMRDATDMTRAMQMSIVANQLKGAAATAQGPMAKARALQAAGQLDQQAAPILSQVAMRRTLMGGAAQGNIPPESVIRMIVPPGEQAGAYKELQNAQNMSKGRDNLLSAFDQVADINNVGNRIAHPYDSGKQINAIQEPLLAQLVKDSEGRITPQDTKMISSLFPAPGESDQTRALKRIQLNKFISEKMNFPSLKAVGIDASRFGQFNPQGQSRFQESAPVPKR